MFVLLCNVPVLVTAQSQVQAITDVYNALGVPSGWMQGDPCTNHWTGVACNAQDDIIEMYPTRDDSLIFFELEHLDTCVAIS